MISFGDPVTFTHHYRRFIGSTRFTSSQVWPRGDRSRYGRSMDYSLGIPERHPDSTIDVSDPTADGWSAGRPLARRPVTWQRVPNTYPAAAPIVGVFGGECRKAEGWMTGTWGPVGHTFKLHSNVALTEVMVERPHARPLFYVVHLDDLTPTTKEPKSR